MTPSVLVIDDDRTVGRAQVRELASAGYDVRYADSGKAALTLLEGTRFDAVITDLKLPDVDGFEILRFITDRQAARATIVVTAFGSIDLAVEAMHRGASDFLTKPYDLDRVKKVLGASLQRTAHGESVVDQARAWRRRYAPELVGEDSGLLRVLHVIERVANTDANVLILGESGTGKEMVATVLHRASSRAAGPFVALSCAAIPDSLVESELFGHKKGSFTGADASRVGRFLQASGGTLFLDEVGEMSAPMQAKVLRIIQEREVTPVGDTVSQKVDVRLIAATHRDLKQRVAEGHFRQDLYFRLHVIPIRLPPLRERPGDVELLAAHTIERVNRKSARRVTGLSASALDALKAHPWPGNVRELENMIENVVTLKGEGVIEGEDLGDLLLPGAAEPDAPAGEPQNFKAAVDEFEAKLIRKALKQTQGNQKKAAEALGIHRTTLIEKMRRFGIREDGEG